MRFVWAIFLCLALGGCGCVVDLYYSAPMTFGVRITPMIVPYPVTTAPARPVAETQGAKP